jgi:hypothetical protein
MKHSSFKNCFLLSIVFFFISSSYLTGQQQTQRTSNADRCERLLMDFGWRFAYGHAADAQKDFRGKEFLAHRNCRIELLCHDTIHFRYSSDL